MDIYVTVDTRTRIDAAPDNPRVSSWGRKELNTTYSAITPKMSIHVCIIREKHVSRSGKASVATNPGASVNYGTPAAPFEIRFPRKKNR